jgi:hypothetical protein
MEQLIISRGVDVVIIPKSPVRGQRTKTRENICKGSDKGWSRKTVDLFNTYTLFSLDLGASVYASLVIHSLMRAYQQPAQRHATAPNRLFAVHRNAATRLQHSSVLYWSHEYQVLLSPFVMKSAFKNWVIRVMVTTPVSREAYILDHYAGSNTHPDYDQGLETLSTHITPHASSWLVESCFRVGYNTHAWRLRYKAVSKIQQLIYVPGPI